jgi:hypothetical protein
MALLALGLGACGDALVDGGYSGDKALRLQGTLGSSVGVPERPQVGALWLSYSAAMDGGHGSKETTILPISSVPFPPSFVFDVVGVPPSVGAYLTHDGRIIPASVRFARLVLFDDRDGDGRWQLDESGLMAPPDQPLARAERHLLAFVGEPPADASALAGSGNLLTNWSEATPGFHLVELDPIVAAPDFAGRLVATDTPIGFTPTPATREAP